MCAPCSSQFGYETGLNGLEVDGLVIGLIAFNLVAAVLPTSQTFVPEEKVVSPRRVGPPPCAGARVQGVLSRAPAYPPSCPQAVSSREAGPLQDPRITLANPKRFFGVQGFGFSKANELFVGRYVRFGLR